MNETKLKLFQIAVRLESMSKEMRSNFPGLVGAILLNFYADEILELAKELDEILS